MKNIIIMAFLYGVSITSYSQQTLQSDISKLLKTELEKESIKSVFLHIYSNSKVIDIQLAESESTTEGSFSIDSPFYTASITKMYTATSIGILKDMGKLEFEDKIDQYLPKSMLNKLHFFDGKDYTNEIKISHLLQHTSGLPDYFTDATIDGSSNIINQLLIDVNKSWTAQELIQFTKDKMKPLFVPGQGYHYTDTEYVLLSLIIEEISGMSLDEFFQKYIFKPLEMNGSYINLKSLPLNNTLPIAKFYANNFELSSISSLSADWGGGGLVSTTQDLIKFFVAYNNNKIIKNNTKLAMQDWVVETSGMDYGFGIRKVSFKDLYNKETDLQLIGHTGSTAAFLWYCPQLDTYIAGTLNQLSESKATINLVYKLLMVVENYR